MSPWRTPLKRVVVAMIVLWAFTTLGFGIGLHIVSDKADQRELSNERTDRLNQDCQARVEARDVLRDVITQAYTPINSQPPEVEAAIAARKDALLDRVPPLQCDTKAGIPIPVPVGSGNPTTTAGAEPVG